MYLQCLFHMWKLYSVFAEEAHLRIYSPIYFAVSSVDTILLLVVPFAAIIYGVCCPVGGDFPCTRHDGNTDPDNSDHCNGPNCSDRGGLMMDGIATRAECLLSDILSRISSCVRKQAPNEVHIKATLVANRSYYREMRLLEIKVDLSSTHNQTSQIENGWLHDLIRVNISAFSIQL